jgi:hypothetical protein
LRQDVQIEIVLVSNNDLGPSEDGYVPFRMAIIALHDARELLGGDPEKLLPWPCWRLGLASSVWDISIGPKERDRHENSIRCGPRKRDSNRCMVMKIWNQSKFGLAAEGCPLNRQDQIQNGWISKGIAVASHVRMIGFISSRLMPKEAR